MSDGPEGTGISRRKVLYALTAVGAAGSVAGFQTGAFLNDRERFRNELVSGALDLTVALEVLSGPRDRLPTSSSDGRVTLPIPELGRGDGGAVKLTLSLPDLEEGVNNPAYVWMRSVCPDPSSTLADHLRVGLWYADCDTGDRLDGGRLTDDGTTLRTLANDLLNGRPLDAEGRAGTVAGAQACLTDQLCLRLEYELDEAYVGTEQTELTFDFVAVQCRHDDGRVSPFPTVERECAPPEEPPEGNVISYIEVTFRDATGAVRTGKLELSEAYVDGCYAVLDTHSDANDDPADDPRNATPDDPTDDGGHIGENYIAPGTYDLPVDDDCADTGVDIVVLSTSPPTGETRRLAFKLVDPSGDDPDILQVVVKGGPGVSVYYDETQSTCTADRDTTCIPTTFVDPEGDGSANATDGQVSAPESPSGGGPPGGGGRP